MNQSCLMKPQDNHNQSYRNHKKTASYDGSQCPGPETENDKTGGNTCYKQAALKQCPYPSLKNILLCRPAARGKNGNIYRKQRDDTGRKE